jgi:hypothetical protein
VCVDVGREAGADASTWLDVLQRLVATRMINDRPHLEMAIILYGSDRTQNVLWSSEQEEYAGVDVVSVCALWEQYFWQLSTTGWLRDRPCHIRLLL